MLRGGEYISYIQFTEGGAVSTTADFIDGIAPGMPAELADMNPAQRAAFVAKAAADQAVGASKGDDDGALCYAIAAEAAATEVLITATIMLKNNPRLEIVEGARKAIKEAEKAIQDAARIRGELVDKGAECEEPEAYEREGFDIPVDEKPFLIDTDQASEP